MGIAHKCTFRQDDKNKIFECSVTDIVVETRFQKFEHDYNAYVAGFRCEHQIVRFIPKGIDSCFPYLTHVTIRSCQLQMITKNDMSQFKQIFYLDLSNNLLKVLEEDLFRNNKHLEIIRLNDNLLIFIQSNAFYSPTCIRFLNLENNLCYSMVYQSTLECLSKEPIASFCPFNQKVIIQCPADRETFPPKCEKLQKDIQDFALNLTQECNDLKSYMSLNLNNAISKCSLTACNVTEPISKGIPALKEEFDDLKEKFVVTCFSNTVTPIVIIALLILIVVMQLIMIFYIRSNSKQQMSKMNAGNNIELAGLKTTSPAVACPFDEYGGENEGNRNNIQENAQILEEMYSEDTQYQDPNIYGQELYSEIGS